jgi:uncharacterized protein (UPF0333 family)
MDNRGKAAALVGLSAIGGILAYYGISQYGNEKEEPVEVETISKETSVNNDKKEESVADTVGSYLTNLVTGNKNIKLSIDETDGDKEQSKEASTEKVTSKESTKPVGNEDNKAKWSKYWSNEYDKQQNNNKLEEEASAADFN